MKNNGKNKNLIRIAAMTSMTIFSLMAVFTGSLAWFNANRVVNQNGDNMQVERIGSCLKRVSFHAQVGTKSVVENEVTHSYYLFEKAEYAYITINNDNAASSLTFNKNSGAYKDWYAKTDKTSTLSTYSLLSQDHPILILFDIATYTSENPSSIKLDFKTDSQYMGFADSITNSGNPLSSVVEFSSFGLTGVLPSGGRYESATQSYSDTYLYGLERQINYDKKWVTINQDESASFDEDGIINIFSNLNAQGTPSSTVYTQIGVIMNYSIASLEYIYARFLGEPVLDENIYFTWDWIMEM